MNAASGAGRPPVPRPTACANCPARGDALCASLADHELHDLEAIRAGERRVAAGEAIFRQGEPCNSIYTIRSGWAFLQTLLPDGKRQIDAFCVRGAILGLPFDVNAPMQFGAQALTDVTLCVLPVAAAVRLTERVPHLALAWARSAAAGQECAFRHLADIGRRDARQRLANLLLELNGMAARAAPQGRGDLPVNHQDLADALGLTPVHISRVLKAWRENAIVAVGHGHLRILDAGRLKADAAADAP